jgi:predicted site-specific integrase-resolvase
VADPKNELDVQLGRIVNDSAFKVSVKMVSGEVGKELNKKKKGKNTKVMIYILIMDDRKILFW